MYIKTYLLAWVCACTFIFPLYTENKKQKVEEFSPLEDLMREHGLLNRLLLIYEACIKRIDCGEYPRDVLLQTVEIMQTFIEGYHEKLEEKYLFPLFEKHSKEYALTRILRKQHVQGRKVTTQIQALLLKHKTGSQTTLSKIKKLLQQFIDMYRPHEAREDTILFPAVHKILDQAAFDKLGDIFDQTEEALFGKHGFERMIKKIEDMEKKLGIFDLDQFTPRF